MAERNSNFEMLRILCIIGIVSMHILAPVYNTLEGVNLYFGVLINSLFNVGVTCFTLISGYFGIRFKAKKLFMLETLVLSYTVLDLLLMIVQNEPHGLRDVVFAFFPISMRRYWYVTCYFALSCLAPFLNDFVEKCSKKYLVKLLGVMFVIFYVVPTLTIQRDIMMDDGKGLANMIFVYLLGRYFNRSGESIKPRNALFLFALTFAVEFLLNSILTYIRGGGVFAPFSRDCSALILVMAVALFWIFKEICFRSRLINVLARGTFATYIFEEIIRNRFDLKRVTITFADKECFAGYVLITAVLLFAICSLVEVVRSRTLTPVYGILYDAILKESSRLRSAALKFTKNIREK